MSRQEAQQALARLIAEIDFSTEHYYNLYFESEADAPAKDLGGEVWTNLSSLTADLTRVRGELSRLRLGVEQLRMPAMEAIGLDKVAEQLRGLEMRLRPVSEMLSRSEDEGPMKRLMKDLLNVSDTLDRVFDLIDQQPGAISEGIERGLRSVYQLLFDTLGRHGLKAMVIEDTFDPRLHMAVGTEPVPGKAENSISRIMQKGYMLNETVFRTAQVVLVKNAPAG